jgi:hypothetical protein
MEMDYYLYKRYSPFSQENFSLASASPSYTKADPFTYSAKRFLHDLGRYQPQGSLEDLINLKFRVSKSKVELILSQFEEIRKQKDEGLKSIEYDQLRVQNLILALSPEIYKDYRRIFEFYRRKLDLYREARMQDTWFLRNTIRLGEELRESLIELKMETEKKRLLSELEEGGDVGIIDKYAGDLNY